MYNNSYRADNIITTNNYAPRHVLSHYEILEKLCHELEIMRFLYNKKYI